MEFIWVRILIIPCQMFNLQRKLGEGTSQSLGKWQIEKKVEFSKVKFFDVIKFVELQLMKLLHYQFQVCNFVIIWKVSVLLLIVMDYLYFDMNIKHLHPTVLQCYGWEIQHKIEIIWVETPSNISLFRKLSISCDLMRFGPIYNWDVILSFHYWPGETPLCHCRLSIYRDSPVGGVGVWDEVPVQHQLLHYLLPTWEAWGPACLLSPHLEAYWVMVSLSSSVRLRDRPE